MYLIWLWVGGKSRKQVGAEQRCVVVEREETPSPLHHHLVGRRRAVLSRRAIISGRRANGQSMPDGALTISAHL